MGPCLSFPHSVVINVILRLSPQRWVFTGCGGRAAGACGEYVIRDDK